MDIKKVLSGLFTEEWRPLVHVGRVERNGTVIKLWATGNDRPSASVAAVLCKERSDANSAYIPSIIMSLTDQPCFENASHRSPLRIRHNRARRQNRPE